MMSDPVAFFLTWSAYGNWLHGDARGSVDRDHNVFGSPTLPPSEIRASHDEQRMGGEPAHFDFQARQIIMETISSHCRFREWSLYAVNARSNHVHVVVGFAGFAPEAMMGQFKAWVSRRLREAGKVGPNDLVWARHGSTQYIWKESDVEGAVNYVVDGQDSARWGSASGL